MLVDLLVLFLIWDLFIWGFASALNKSIFKTKPASKVTAWVLTIFVFLLSLFVLSAGKTFIIQYFESSIGLQAKTQRYLSGGAFISSWFFLDFLKRKEKPRIASGKLAKSTSKTGKWNYVGIGMGTFMLLFVFLPDIINGTLFSQHYIGVVFWVGVIICCSLNVMKQTDNKLKNEKQHDNNKVDSSNYKPKSVNNELFSDEKYYGIALKEIEANRLSSGLSGKALAYGDGDQGKAKSYYPKARSKQLMQLHQQKLNNFNIECSQHEQPLTILSGVSDKKSSSLSGMDSVVITIVVIISIIVTIWGSEFINQNP